MSILLDLNLPDARASTPSPRPGARPRRANSRLTGLDDEATGTQALKSGAQDYLVKGRFDGVHLIHAIRYARREPKGLALKPGRPPTR